MSWIQQLITEPIGRYNDLDVEKIRHNIETFMEKYPEEKLIPFKYITINDDFENGFLQIYISKKYKDKKPDRLFFTDLIDIEVYSETRKGDIYSVIAMYSLKNINTMEAMDSVLLKNKEYKIIMPTIHITEYEGIDYQSFEETTFNIKSNKPFTLYQVIYGLFEKWKKEFETKNELDDNFYEILESINDELIEFKIYFSEDLEFLGESTEKTNLYMYVPIINDMFTIETETDYNYEKFDDYAPEPEYF